MAGTGFSFDRLIAPIGRPSFFRDNYEKAPLIVHRGDPEYYGNLLRLDDVWDHIETNCPGPDDLRLVRFGADQQPTDHMTADRRADPIRLAALFDEGWTISLNGMQEHLLGLRQLCASAEAAFSAPFQTNLYLTPPGAQGFVPHWDTHDVFVLQVHGSKDWTLYDTPIELPLVGQSFDEHKPAPGPISAEFTLHAGDLLYCPRGLMHAAHAASDISLHITFGLMARTWSELVLEAVSKAILSEPSLRRNLPVGFARSDFPREKAAADYARLLATVAERADFTTAFEHMRERFVGSRIPRRPGHMREIARLGELSSSSRVGVRPDLVWHLDGDEEQVRLSCGTSFVTFPGFTRDAIAAVMVADDIVVRDLPGPLDEDGKVTLVRRMIKEGFARTLA